MLGAGGAYILRRLFGGFYILYSHGSDRNRILSFGLSALLQCATSVSVGQLTERSPIIFATRSQLVYFPDNQAIVARFELQLLECAYCPLRLLFLFFYFTLIQPDFGAVSVRCSFRSLTERCDFGRNIYRALTLWVVLRSDGKYYIIIADKAPLTSPGQKREATASTSVFAFSLG